jgi:hypothetical protein
MDMTVGGALFLPVFLQLLSGKGQAKQRIAA